MYVKSFQCMSNFSITMQNYMIGFKCMLVTVMLCGGFLIIDLKMDYNKKMHPSTNFLEILFIGQQENNDIET